MIAEEAVKAERDELKKWFIGLVDEAFEHDEINFGCPYGTTELPPLPGENYVTHVLNGKNRVVIDFIDEELAENCRKAIEARLDG